MTDALFRALRTPTAPPILKKDGTTVEETGPDSEQYRRPIQATVVNRAGLIAAMTDLLEAGGALRRSKLASWAIAQREADLQIHLSHVVQQIIDWDDAQDALPLDHAPRR